MFHHHRCPWRLKSCPWTIYREALNLTYFRLESGAKTGKLEEIRRLTSWGWQFIPLFFGFLSISGGDFTGFLPSNISWLLSDSGEVWNLHPVFEKDFVNRRSSFIPIRKCLCSFKGDGSRRLWIDLLCSIFIVNFILFHAAIVRSHVKQNG